MSGSESGRIGHGQTAEEVVSFVKAEVVMAVLHGEVVAAEIARQHGVHETLVYKWKRQFLEAGKQSSGLTHVRFSCRFGRWKKRSYL